MGRGPVRHPQGLTVNSYKWWRDPVVWFLLLLFAVNTWCLYAIAHKCADNEVLMKVGITSYTCVERR